MGGYAKLKDGQQEEQEGGERLDLDVESDVDVEPMLAAARDESSIESQLAEFPKTPDSGEECDEATPPDRRPCPRTSNHQLVPPSAPLVAR